METTPDTNLIRVTVDDRERLSGVIDCLRARRDVRVTVQRLAVGDYLVDGRLLAERKTLVDFGQSVVDRRLFHQLYRLRGSRTERVCLVLEGTSRDLRRVRLTRAGFQGALLTTTLSFGVPVLRSRSRRETAELLLIAAHQLRRRQAAPVRRRSPRRDTVAEAQRRLLESIAVVGPVRSEALLTAFGSPAGIVAASEQELARVPGIGPVAAGRVWRVLHEAIRPDGDGSRRRDG